MLYSACLNFSRIAAEGEAVADRHLLPSEVGGGAKAKGGNAFIAVIVHENAGDGVYGELILIGRMRVHIVEGSGCAGVPV